ncbi:Sterile alpha motif type 2 [Penicillium bovifimosum]|uniref:Sterile alpha motif type 2 n=1 Tax=Penicillium bovifimosum TaxID=126998 RepID=A0A9W9GW50_9EURO|nr:Sterile alpha motif type 2 [Penicillium bovifimosum]KAJ5130973.1 Sterile alpha motif type 2 [Penicillium bovifimosum]
MVTMGPPQGVRPGDILEVLHEFGGRGEDELIMLPRDKIELVELDEGFGDAWYLGKNLRTGQTGLFPANFTRIGAPPKALAESPVLVESPTQVESPVPGESAFASIGSGQSTPQASRHASTADMQSPQFSSPAQQRSASSPLPRPSLAAEIQQAFRGPIGDHINGEDSPVMNETLSVIDEHITDMNTPRHSVSTQEPRTINDSGSEYSSHIGHRASYINGHETDDEEQNHPTEQEVRGWDQAQTSRCLRGLGIEPKHCDIFEEQEITGDVLLDMDQDFIFMKEFDFGVMGKRLKTWHKIKAFQEDTKGFGQYPGARGSISSGFSGPSPSEDRATSRAGHTGPLLPRIPTLSDKTGAGYPRASAPVQHPRLASNNSSPMTPHTPPFNNDPSRRMSAASIRELNHTRRHSSIDATQRGMSDTVFNGHHHKNPSFDRSWTLNSGPQTMPARPGTSMGTTSGFRGGPLTAESDSYTNSYQSTPDQIDDLDRGYFSGTEVDSRRTRRHLQKRASAAAGSMNNHSRKSSYADDQYRVISPAKRQSRIGSVDSIREAAKHVSPAAQAYHSTPPKSRLRSLSTRLSSDRAGSNPQSSTSDSKGSGGFFANFSRVGGSKDLEGPSARAAPLQFQPLKNAGPKFRRAMGLRAISDVVGKKPETSAPDSPRDSDPTSARTGSTTPSATSKSSERHSTDGSGKAAFDKQGFVVRPRTVKSKKETSAYTRGLEKKTPAEQMEGCDYSGWMKKRSSNLMTTWKPRLFVLRGRRLSYYYSEDDTEERGLIDITAHRVLRADQDPIIALHATITGSTALPANANNTAEGSGSHKLTTPSVIQSLTSKDGSGPFFFKLVPPKNSRAVQFTKPATHYFQVDNVQQGRLWMGALMKATIERDLGQAVESTNKQKTISLKQARLMNQRPPDLTPASGNTKTEQTIDEEEEDSGLQIDGLNLPPAYIANSFDDTNSDLNDNEDEEQERPVSNLPGDFHAALLPDPLAKTESK